MKNESFELLNKWIHMGIYYGYPPCCIREFMFETGPKAPRKFHGTGYVPCKDCNKKPEEHLLAYIKAHRHEPYPFPLDVNSTYVTRIGVLVQSILSSSLIK